VFANDAISGDKINGGTIGSITIGNLALTTDLTVANGGTGVSSLIDGGILYGNGTGAIGAMGVLDDGAIIVGDGVTAPGEVSVFTASGGYVKHESGGLEFNASAVADGDFVVGTGAGTMGLDNAATVRTTLNVENGATADQTGAEIATALSAQAVTGLTDLETDVLQLMGQKFQSFIIKLVNTAGTLQHQIVADESLSLPAADLISQIANASATLANTPEVNSGVDFTSGGGIVPGNIFILDTALAVRANKSAYAVISFNTTGTDLMVELEYSNANVNGTSRLRPMLHVTSTGAGAAFGMTTSTIASGKEIRFQVFGFIT